MQVVWLIFSGESKSSSTCKWNWSSDFRGTCELRRAAGGRRSRAGRLARRFRGMLQQESCPQPTVLLAWAAVVLFQESNVVGVLLTHSRENATSTHCAAFLWLFPWILYSDTFPETNSWVHTQLFKQAWLPYSFVCLFWLRVTACGILVPWRGIEPRVLGSESMES